MAVKQAAATASRQFHTMRRKKKLSNREANRARQKANKIPRDCSGQPSNAGDFTKKPLVLHNTAATSTIAAPRQDLVDSIDGVDDDIQRLSVLATLLIHCRPESYENTWGVL